MNGFSDPIFWIVLASFVLGLLVLLGMAFLYLRSYPRVESEMFAALRHVFYDFPHPIRNDQQFDYSWGRAVTAWGESVSDAMAKREVFWALLIQSAVSLVVVVFIAILLLLKIVSAEAGLPILAAFGGATISQGVSSSRAASRARSESPPAPPLPEEER